MSKMIGFSYFGNKLSSDSFSVINGTTLDLLVSALDTLLLSSREIMNDPPTRDRLLDA